MKLVTSETEKIAPAKTASLAHRTGRRRGTAVSEDRIMPVLYSPLIRSTPSTPKATTAKLMPVRLVLMGLKAALSAALKVWYWLAVTAENSAPMPIVKATGVRTALIGLPPPQRPRRNGSPQNRR